MKALITGVAGFAGSHLAEHLLTQGHQVCGIVIPGGSLHNVSHILDRITVHEGDILQPKQLQKIISEEQPDWVFHLAAMSSVSTAWKNPALAFEVNVTGGIHLIEACLPLKNKIRVVLITSAEVFGNHHTSRQNSEVDSYAPQNPYAVTKLAIDLVADQVAQSHGLSLVRMRPMNHTGPRQAAGFVIPDFAKQIVEIELGLAEPVLKVGNLKAYRDFTDVRDMARAYALAADHGRAGEAYIVCSGESRLIQDALDSLLSFSKVPITVEQDPEKFRPVDANISAATPSQLTAVTGWRPEIPFDQTLQDTLDYWREKLNTGSLRH